MVALKHRSKDRPRGTVETKPITTVTKEILKKMTIEKVSCKISKKTSVHHKNSPVYIKQETVKPHTANLDEIPLNEGVQNIWNNFMTS